MKESVFSYESRGSSDIDEKDGVSSTWVPNLTTPSNKHFFNEVSQSKTNMPSWFFVPDENIKTQEVNKSSYHNFKTEKAQEELSQRLLETGSEDEFVVESVEEIVVQDDEY